MSRCLAIFLHRSQFCLSHTHCNDRNDARNRASITRHKPMSHAPRSLVVVLPAAHELSAVVELHCGCSAGSCLNLTSQLTGFAFPEPHLRREWLLRDAGTYSCLRRMSKAIPGWHTMPTLAVTLRGYTPARFTAIQSLT